MAQDIIPHFFGLTQEQFQNLLLLLLTILSAIGLGQMNRLFNDGIVVGRAQKILFAVVVCLIVVCGSIISAFNVIN